MTLSVGNTISSGLLGIILSGLLGIIGVISGFYLSQRAKIQEAREFLRNLKIIIKMELTKNHEGLGNAQPLMTEFETYVIRQGKDITIYPECRKEIILLGE